MSSETAVLRATGVRSEQGLAAAVVREPYLAPLVACVGGLPGCGKTLLNPIVGSLARVEIQKYNYTLEHVCVLRLLGKLDDDAATVMIRMLTDLDLYNLMMARETNVRWSDLSSVFSNSGGWRYLRRLFQPGDRAVPERIQRERPILHLITHNVLAISPPLFRALGGRFRLVELVRHPLYMIKQWYLYVEQYGTDPRDFTIWVDHHGQAVPFFAQGWEARYLGANLMDRSIYAIEHLTALGHRVLEGLTPEERARVLMIPFEQFVFSPWPFLRQMEMLLDTHVTRLTARDLRRQGVPRVRISDGVRRKVYLANGWEPSRQKLTEAEELQHRRQFAAEHATPQAMAVLDQLCRSYEQRYPCVERGR